MASHAADPSKGRSALHMLAGALACCGLLDEAGTRAMAAVEALTAGCFGESCGLAIELPEWRPGEQYAYFKTLPMKAFLYKLTLQKDARGVNRVLKAEEVL